MQAGHLPAIHYMVLAHENPACVEDLLQALRETSPTATLSVFNGGRDRSFFQTGSVPVCPRSRPLKYGNLTGFHLEGMQWLVDTEAPFDYLVTLDCDVLPLRPGFEHYLAQKPEVGYFGTRLQSAPTWEGWEHGPTIFEILQTWQRRWQPLVQMDVPMWAFNPCQVFRRDTVYRIISLPELTAIKKQAYGSKVWALEEVVLPTLATRVSERTSQLPGDDSVNWRAFAPREIQDFTANYFIHRVTMSLDAPDRVAVHAVRRGLPVPEALLAFPAADAGSRAPLPALWHPARWRHALRRRYRPLHLRYRG